MVKQNGKTIDLGKIERNHVASQSLTYKEWIVVRNRVELLRLRVAAHVLDTYVYGGLNENDEKS